MQLLHNVLHGLGKTSSCDFAFSFCMIAVAKQKLGHRQEYLAAMESFDVSKLVLKLEKLEHLKRQVLLTGTFINWPGIVGENSNCLAIENSDLCIELIQANSGSHKAPKIKPLRVLTKLLLEVFMAPGTAQSVHVNSWALKRMYTKAYRKGSRKQ